MLNLNSRLTFGKCKGMLLKNIPQSYFIDFYKNHFDKYDELNQEKQDFILYILGVVDGKLLHNAVDDLEFRKLVGGFCPKEFFISESDAKYRLAYIRKMTADNKLKYHSDKIPIRVYKCNHCDYWHLTSQELRTDKVFNDNSEEDVEEYELKLKDKWLKLMEE